MSNTRTGLGCLLLSITLFIGLNQVSSVADEQPTSEEKPKITSLWLRDGQNVSSSPLVLVQKTNIQNELKLNDEQLFQIREVFKANRPEKYDREKFKNLSKEERTKKLKQRRKTDFARQEKLEGLVIQILSFEQATRLRQLVARKLGVAVFRDDEFVNEIKLQDEQLKQIRNLITIFQNERKKFFDELGSLRPSERKRKAFEFLKSLPARQQQLSDNLISLMTAEQRDKFQELRGEPFEFLQ